MCSLLSPVIGATRGEPGPRPPRGRGVLLINLGTPQGYDIRSIRRYLSEFLSDPAVIRLPTGLGLLNRPLGRLIARFRAPKSAEMYKRIWTEHGSPLATISKDQCESLQAALPKGWRVFHAMRYGQPSIPDTLRRIEAAGIEDLVVIPMYPQFSGPTTATAMRSMYEYLEEDGHPLHVTTRTTWYDDHGYINAQVELMEQYAQSNRLTPDNTYLLFSTHGLPVSYVRKGDPYPAHVARTVALVSQRLGWPADRMSLAYQSRLGPVKWLEPFTDNALVELAAAGEKQVLVCPISFTTDCLETLEELDIRTRKIAESAGTEMFLCPALNTFPPFISALKHLVLRGPQPMECAAREVRTHKSNKVGKTESRDARDMDSLVMIGLSTRARLDSEHAPNMNHTDRDGLRAAKRSACEVPALLKAICDKTRLREAWLFNTCHRFELYGWLDETDDEEDRAKAVAAIRRHLFEGRDVPEQDVNVLSGVEAWHHLVRSACGLNSSLPGERDIFDQLLSAHRLADRAGTAGPLARRMLEDVTALERLVRSETDWGRYDPDYCHAALSRIAESAKLDFASCRIVVIGGSTTSASVLRTLTQRFEVPSRQLTLLYRGHKHGGHLKILRKAIGNGRRIRVSSYAEQSVIEAVAKADVVVFGLDRKEPVLESDATGGCRDFSKRPLTVIDFNTFPSTKGLDEIDGVTVHPLVRLDAEVAAHADELCSTESFLEAARAAEDWILEHGLEPGAKSTAVQSPAHQPAVTRDLVDDLSGRRRGGAPAERRSSTPIAERSVS